MSHLYLPSGPAQAAIDRELDAEEALEAAEAEAVEDAWDRHIDLPDLGPEPWEGYR